MAKKKVSKKKQSRSAIKPAARRKPSGTPAKAPKAAGAARSAGPDWQSLTAADIMQRDVVTVATSMALSEVEQILSENRITGAPVTDEAGHIVGVLSARDLLDRHAQEPEGRQERGLGYFSMPNNELEDEDLEGFEPPTGSEPETTAGEVMTAQVYTVAADAGLRKVAREMVKHGIHRVLVQEANRTVGIISTTDMLRVMAK